VVLWLFLAREGLRWGLAIFAVAIALAIVASKLHIVYEQDGRAIRIARPQYRVSFPDGLRLSLRLLRYSFFVCAALLLLFGIVPLRFEVAKAGMIASVLALFVTGLAHFAIELHYARRE